MRYANGNVYEGEWCDGKREGWGKMTYGEENIHEGMWENNVQHGWGRIISLDGEVTAEGEWENGKRVHRDPDSDYYVDSDIDADWIY
jgi:hypothetical protein